VSSFLNILDFYLEITRASSKILQAKTETTNKKGELYILLPLYRRGNKVKKIILLIRNCLHGKPPYGLGRVAK
jgi:hypothetical protein